MPWDPSIVELLKLNLSFYHKLNSVANNCSFTNNEEIVKFLFLTYNQNTRVHEHLLKEMQDTTSMTDMLCMAHVCEGTVYPEEISKQYLEPIKTVKQVDAINQHQRSASASKGRGHGQSQSRHRSQSKGRPSGNCSNCGSSHPPGGAKHLVKNATIATKQTIFPSTAGPSNMDVPHPKQNLMVPDNHTVM